ncbi:protein of unknown function [Candidatus Hydrogenisulfobacillus filiaventi]|uniref:Uncharacterized protein n=1 Tax=Candidatus Hydrogenisulfobacillus filiaventi TaxID=2707344 RepID=A0A6F8ZIS1_9FIRM|nr:protein of unknown function [Candidatus Hydrogenisulfobacillus filiaventi]
MTDRVALTVIAVALVILAVVALAVLVAAAAVAVQLLRLQRTVLQRVDGLEQELRGVLERAGRVAVALPAAGQWAGLAASLLQWWLQRTRPARQPPWWQQALGLGYGLWQLTRPRAGKPSPPRKTTGERSS